MAETPDEHIVIKKDDPSFPDFLNFEKLRSEGIAYIGELSGKLWTDHNVHDPGITILEVLCYALLDLGYRTSMPVEDILARNADATGPDDNFFTPAEILTCNPLTIIDFRKLLMDIDGVRNAWLEIADESAYDVYWFGEDANRRPGGLQCGDPQKDRGNDEHRLHLNGLYNVYIEADNLPADAVARDQALAEIKERVRESLMAHRNFCEDFLSLTILCQEDMGVCTLIDIDESADPQQVIKDLIHALQEFFSPSVQYYTLQQMLTEKNRTMEEIFEGRAYKKSSHGFIDTEELESIHRIKVIHLSDLFGAMNKIDGVRSVNRLLLNGYVNGLLYNSADPKIDQWDLPLAYNHLPVLSLIHTQIMLRKGNTTFLFNSSNLHQLISAVSLNGTKVLFHLPSPHLDGGIPQGIYHADFATYRSIQNDFPHVYGIGNGDLNDTLPLSRKVKAWQLKGYLLFFDQLLANYLAQLQNIRSLFSNAPSAIEQTYFSGMLNDVPELDRLLRFENGGLFTGLDWEESDAVALPVKVNLLDILNSEYVQQDVVETWRKQYYTLAHMHNRDTALQQLSRDAVHGTCTINTYVFDDGCWFFVIGMPATDYVLLATKYYPSKQDAQAAAQAVVFLLAYTENIRPFSFVGASGEQYSFNVVFTLSRYSDFLQRIIEDPALYIQRKEAFLNHLLARFAERFTDYSLLLYGVEEEKKPGKALHAKEVFLQHYDSLGRNRGKAYDYRVNKWNSNNTSGYEKRVLALAGVSDWKRRYHCHFEVGACSNLFYAELKDGDNAVVFRSTPFVQNEDAQMAFAELAKKAKEESNYQRTDDRLRKRYGFYLLLRCGKAVHPQVYSTTEDREAAIKRLVGAFNEKLVDGRVAVARTQYFLQLKNNNGSIILHTQKGYADRDAALKAGPDLVKKATTMQWLSVGEDIGPLPKLKLLPVDAEQKNYINTAAFKAGYEVIKKKASDHYRLKVMEGDTVLFVSTHTYTDRKDAAGELDEILKHAAVWNDYIVKPIGKDPVRYVIELHERNKTLARFPIDFEVEKNANEVRADVFNEIAKQLFLLDAVNKSSAWNIQLQLNTLAVNEPVVFEGTRKYTDEKSAGDILQKLLASPEQLTLQSKGNRFMLYHAATGEELEHAASEAKPDEEKKIIQSLAMIHAGASSGAEAIPQLIAEKQWEEAAEHQRYEYRVVNKNECLAFHYKTFASKADADAPHRKLCSQTACCLDYLEICMDGSDVVQCYKDSNGARYYYFVIRGVSKKYCSTLYPEGEVLYLRSYAEYVSEEEALQAFHENVLEIIRLACTSSSYGKLILWGDEDISRVQCATSAPLAVVPGTTINLLGGRVSAPAKLTLIMRSFPYRQVHRDKRILVHLYSVDEKLLLWKFSHVYDTLEEARNALQFFFVLTRYHGNCRLCFNEAICRYTIVMQEILLHSCSCDYVNEEAAWGEEFCDDNKRLLRTGLEAMLHAAREPGAYYPYREEENGCYSFWLVRKGFRLATHSCRFNTEAERDLQIQKLIEWAAQHPKCKEWLRAVPVFNDNRQFYSIQLQTEDGRVLLQSYPKTASPPFYNYLNKTASQDWLADHVNVEVERWLFLVLDLVWTEQNFEWNKTINAVVLKGYYGEPVAFYHSREKNVENEISIWKLDLRNQVLHYPYTRIETEDEVIYRFRLYADDLCCDEEEPDDSQPCGCNRKTRKPSGCMIWESTEGYSCREAAQQDFERFCKALAIAENYRPLFGNDCGPFGIELVDLSFIVACNPQCYPFRNDVLQAIIRAKETINDEGLHVVEHLLLRPGKERDCACLLTAHPSPECTLTWKDQTGNEDPCEIQFYQVSGDADELQEVPPIISDNKASGSISGTYNRKTRTLYYTIGWENLSGPVISAHFHGPAYAGSSTAAVAPIGITGAPSTGSYTDTLLLTTMQEQDLIAGKWYFNLQTNRYPKGEIRGQIKLTPVWTKQYVPGADPYSFVATVVLPCWPLRFHNLATRKQIEVLLRSEAPAHVLLNILWVKPLWFCRFEILYRRWLQWLACKNVCVDKENLKCCLISLLFNREIICKQPDCEEEDPCKKEAPCTNLPDEVPDEITAWINELFFRESDEFLSSCFEKPDKELKTFQEEDLLPAENQDNEEEEEV